MVLKHALSVSNYYYISISKLSCFTTKTPEENKDFFCYGLITEFRDGWWHDAMPSWVPKIQENSGRFEAEEFAKFSLISSPALRCQIKQWSLRASCMHRICWRFPWLKSKLLFCLAWNAFFPPCFPRCPRLPFSRQFACSPESTKAFPWYCNAHHFASFSALFLEKTGNGWWLHCRLAAALWYLDLPWKKNCSQREGQGKMQSAFSSLLLWRGHVCRSRRVPWSLLKSTWGFP